MVACLQQARAIDYRRVWSKLGSLDDTDMENVKVGFYELINKYPLPKQGRGKIPNVYLVYRPKSFCQRAQPAHRAPYLPIPERIE